MNFRQLKQTTGWPSVPAIFPEDEPVISSPKRRAYKKKKNWDPDENNPMKSKPHVGSKLNIRKTQN
jgi:hypothetical protein